MNNGSPHYAIFRDLALNATREELAQMSVAMQIAALGMRDYLYQNFVKEDGIWRVDLMPMMSEHNLLLITESEAGKIVSGHSG